MTNKKFNKIIAQAQALGLVAEISDDLAHHGIVSAIIRLPEIEIKNALDLYNSMRSVIVCSSVSILTNRERVTILQNGWGFDKAEPVTAKLLPYVLQTMADHR
jgi:hypothetical protein